MWQYRLYAAPKLDAMYPSTIVVTVTLLNGWPRFQALSLPLAGVYLSTAKHVCQLDPNLRNAG